MQSIQKGRRKPYRFEQLEDRSMMAGNVAAAVVDGALVLTGDNNANYVVVHQTGSHQFQVQGLATTIKSGSHSGSSFTFKNVDELAVDLRGGADSLNLYNSTLSGTVGINMGSGNDVVTVTNVSSSVFGANLGDGNDVASIYKVSTTAFAVDAGDGRDAVVINTVSANNLGVDMGNGNYDVLTVVLSKATNAGFVDQGTNGTLSRAGNKFTHQGAEGFRWVV